MRVHGWHWLLALIVLLVLASVVAGSRVGAMLSQLKAPELPPPLEVPVANWDSGQNWTVDQAEEFHWKAQGSRTLNIPLSWFLALEAPADGTIGFLFGSETLLSTDAYLSRFGFVPRPKGTFNPYGLPIGFAVTPYQNLPGLEQAESAVGLTCAACHTGQLIYEGKRYLVEGGPAMIDLGLLTEVMGAAVGQTAVSSDIPLFSGRFDRFAQRVLGSRHSEATRFKLKQDLASVVRALAKLPAGIDVTEGFGRLDALNRIGNQVFAWDTGRNRNYVDINSPVNFPHIWTASWFDWVQYDGSIMRPLVRNAGEAVGTAAHTSFFAPLESGRFSTSIPMENLTWIERQLAGPDAPLFRKRFSGLRAPQWPAAFGEINAEKAKQGAALYEQHCAACHRPALTRAIAAGDDPESEFWHHFSPVSWLVNGDEYKTDESYFKVQMVHQDYVGTDPGQGRVLAERKVDTTSGLKEKDSLGIDRTVCARDPNSDGLTTLRVRDAPMLAYPYALGAVVQLGIDHYVETAGLNAERARKFVGDKPNCLQAGQGYKARPLDGVWATPPFLHNGSVPTLRHLLGAPESRPDEFVLGDARFDPVNVGLVLMDVPETDQDYTEDGYFVLRTSVQGNSHRGHEFTDDDREGRIGPALGADEVDALIEFLKTI